MRYDAERAPDPREWLSLDEQQRVDIVKKYHKASRIRLPSMESHALFHTVVENQLAETYGPTCRAMERLRREGLTRHDAVHAIASVVAEFTFQAMKGEGPAPEEAQSTLDARIDALTARTWRKDYDA